MDRNNIKINIEKLVREITAHSGIETSETFLNSLSNYYDLILRELSADCADICYRDSKALLSENHLFSVIKKNGYEHLLKEMIEESERILTEEREIKIKNL